jgi:hypothetical protein
MIGDAAKAGAPRRKKEKRKVARRRRDPMRRVCVRATKERVRCRVRMREKKLEACSSEAESLRMTRTSAPRPEERARSGWPSYLPEQAIQDIQYGADIR